MDTTLSRKLSRPNAIGVTWATLLLCVVLALAAFLNFYNLAALGDGNLYYTAAVESMLDSWRNFFFVAAEPGGSVSVDKPPLGLWLEVLSAAAFGVSGFAVVLPNILAGLGSILIIYHLIQRRYGAGAGLLAALALAVTPVAVAAQRNNTMDAMLTFTLVLAAWTFIKAVETNRLRFLWLGAALVGGGFMIKMLQAYLILPAFFVFYFLSVRETWRHKLRNLALAVAIVLVTSLWWPLVVDLTPAEERPYIGSSENNTVMALIVGHNGVARLFGIGRSGNNGGSTDDAQPNLDAIELPPGAPLPGIDAAAQQLGITPAELVNALGFPPDLERAAQTLGVSSATLEATLNETANLPTTAPPAGKPAPNSSGGVPAGAPGGADEVGTAGMLRFFEAPLSKELSWLLPLGLMGLVLLASTRKPHLPFNTDHQVALLWGGWLVTGLLFFSFASFFHAYYLIMLAPPLAALVGAGAARLWRLGSVRPNLAARLLVTIAIITLAFQAYNAAQFGNAGLWLPLGILFMIVGTILLMPRFGPWRSVGYAVIMLGLLSVPLGWSWCTNQTVANVNLPGAYAGEATRGAAGGAPVSDIQTVNEDLLAYLEANTQDVTYLMAVPSSMQGAPYVLATGRPVFYLGGFSGSDPIVDTSALGRLVVDDELRFVLLGGGTSSQSEIAEWIGNQCTAVDDIISTAVRPATLYDCSSYYKE